MIISGLINLLRRSRGVFKYFLLFKKKIDVLRGFQISAHWRLFFIASLDIVHVLSLVKQLEPQKWLSGVCFFVPECHFRERFIFNGHFRGKFRLRVAAMWTVGALVLVLISSVNMIFGRLSTFSRVTFNFGPRSVHLLECFLYLFKKIFTGKGSSLHK